MKKMKYIFFTFALLFSFCSSVLAATTTNGVTIEENEEENDKTIYHYSLKESDSLCIGKCSGEQTTTSEDYWTCEYTGPSGTLTTKYDGLYLIYYPDGSFTETDTFITPVCDDIYYNKKTKKIKYANGNYYDSIKQMKQYDPSLYNFLCGSSSENIEYYCSGSCKYQNNLDIDCGEVTSTIEGTDVNLGEICSIAGVKKSLRFLGYLLLIVKIIVPIILIVLGVMDFSKATISSDAEALQKSTKTLVTRVVAGVAIFLIPTVVNFVFKGILNSNTSRYNDCRVCIFEPNNCSESDTD